MGAVRNYGRYLVRRGTVYFFRVCIPQDLASAMGPREIRMSLRTGSLREAKGKALVLAGYASKAFDVIRTGVSMSTLDWNKLRPVIVQYFHEQLAKYEKAMLGDGPRTDEMNDKAFDKLKRLNGKANANLRLCNFNSVKSSIQMIMAYLGLDGPNSSFEYRRIGQDVLKANIDAMSILMRRLRGDYKFEDDIYDRYNVGRIERATTSSLCSPTSKGITFYALIDEYCKLKINTGHWTGRSVTEQPSKFDVLKLIIGDVKAEELNSESALRVLDILQKLPKRLDAQRYKGKTLEELLRTKHSETRSIKSINMSMDLAASLFKFAVKNGYVKVNAFEAVRLRDKRKDEDKRFSFTKDDLARIFSVSSYLAWCKDDHSRYWIPILSLYTGARLEELSQLWVGDVYESHGAVVLDINDKMDKRVKTKSAIRIIPIPSLVRHNLGFERYVDALRLAKEERVFPSLNRVQGRYGHGLSRDFGRYLRKIGIEERKTFHSFRHTFIDVLRNKGIPDDHIATVTGHKQGEKSPIPQNYRKELDIYFKVEKVVSYVAYELDLNSLIREY